jgi:hypothetical protein
MSKTDRLGAPERFVARPYVLKGGMTGAALGTFDPGTMAEEELGEIEWGTLMGYMTRRFGPSNIGSDPYKDICSWLVTTPMEGVALSVRITPGATRFLFGYMLDRDLDEELMRLKHERRVAWRTRFGAWCQETHGREPTSWTQSRLPYSGEGAPSREDRTAASAEFDEWRQAFDAQDEGRGADRGKLGQVEDALRRTLRDLKRSVSVRDHDLSVSGDGERFRHVDYDDRAGVAPPSYTRDDEMWKVYAAIHRLGGGMKGLRKLTAIIEREVPAPAQGEASANGR